MVETSAVLYHPLSHAPDPRAESVSAVCEFALGHPLMDEEQQWGSSNPAEASASQSHANQRRVEISASHHDSGAHCPALAVAAGSAAEGVGVEADAPSSHYRWAQESGFPQEARTSANPESSCCHRTYPALPVAPILPRK